MQQFIVLSFAAFISYQVFRTLFPIIPLSARTAPIVVFAIASGLTLLIPPPEPSWLVPIAATGGVALLNKITDVGAPEPWSLPKITLRKPNVSLPKPRIRRHETVDESRIGHRIKTL